MRELSLSLLYTGIAFPLLYTAFLLHDALYPDSGKPFATAALVVVLAYWGFVLLHKAQHVGERRKTLYSPGDMGVDE